VNGKEKLGSARIGALDIFSLRVLKVLDLSGPQWNASFLSRSGSGLHILPQCYMNLL
jgi:hypothetical protein